MKKIPVPVFRFFRILPAAAILAAGLSVCACDLFTYVRPFDDAYYENNFIADIGFDTAVTGVTPADLDETSPRTGQWDFAYRYDNWDGYDYLTLTDTGDTAGDYGAIAGLSASAPVFALEMVNLVENGDFEGGAGIWTETGTSSSWSYITSGDINNASVNITIGGGDFNYLTYAIDPIASQFTIGKSYTLDFKWKSGQGAPVGTSNEIIVNDETSPFSFAADRASSDFTALASNTIRFKTGITWTGSIDDITVRKAGSLQLRLLLARAETEPDLEDFLYVFSFWIHADPSVGASTSPYNLDRLGIQMLPTDHSKLSTRTDDDYVYDPNRSGWQKISVRVENGNLQIDAGTTDAVLELVIDLEDSLPGRVLVAQPELRAYPDGY